MTDNDLAKICNDVTSITIIIDRLNEIGDALEVIESLPWPGADLKDINKGLGEIAGLRDCHVCLTDTMLCIKEKWCIKHGIDSEECYEGASSHTPTSDAKLKTFGQRMTEGD